MCLRFLLRNIIYNIFILMTHLIIIHRSVDGPWSTTVDAFPGRLVDFPVKRQYDQQWHIEGATSGKYL